MPKQWYVGRTKQGRETYANGHLERQGFRTYLPMYLSERGLFPRIRPFLPSYIFISLDPDNDRWRAIWNTFGMASNPLLMSGDKPRAVPLEIIDEMKERERDGLIKLEPRINCKFKKGDRVALRNKRLPLELFFRDIDDKGRVTIFGELFGRAHEFRVPLGKLTAASAAA